VHRRSWHLLLLLAAALATAPAAAGGGDGEFAAIDAHALAAPPWAATSVTALASYLAEPAADDRGKARAIFRWITANIAYDPALREEVLRPEDVLERRRAVCSGYAALFKALAEAAGLEAEIIHGHAKAAGYQAGRGMEASFEHAWNAVRIGGEWALLDCTWGAGWLDGAGRFAPRFTDHYFLTPPEVFADDHFPHDVRWQLLERPISREEYLRRVQRRPAFFEQRLRLVGQHWARMETDGSVSLTIDAPEDTILTACLFGGGREVDTRYTFTQRERDGFVVRALMPERGEYLLRVYAAEKSLPNGELDWALEYAIRSRGGTKSSPFPRTYGAFLVHNCRLETPLAGVLRTHTAVPFSIIVPGAKDVVVMGDGAAERLSARGGGRFAGDARVGEGDVIVLARFSDGTRYEGLLGYRAARTPR